MERRFRGFDPDVCETSRAASPSTGTASGCGSRDYLHNDEELGPLPPPAPLPPGTLTLLKTHPPRSPARRRQNRIEGVDRERFLALRRYTAAAVPELPAEGAADNEAFCAALQRHVAETQAELETLQRSSCFQEHP
ncbi:hypothetical protein DIPPA_09736 [Diplonema papillatum]|nr:hypothetical protein DIPPA_09736 [Diplonema papillatum]